MKRTKLIIGLFMIASSSMVSQTLNDAIKLTTNEQFEKADAAFKTLLQAQPNNGEIYFYYGENYFRNDNIDMANTMYQKGMDVNATNPFPYIGLGKVQWEKGKAADAKALFFKATTLSANKNATVLYKIAEEYIASATKNLADASTLLAQATKLEPNNAAIYIQLGDAYLEQNNGGKAVENYEKAGKLDPKSPIPLIKQGQLYNRAKNYQLALDLYKKSKDIDSTFAPAHREMGEIYFRAGQFKNAVGSYKKYLELNNDCSARIRYAGFLYQAKDYDGSIKAANDALTCDPSNVYLYRYLAYGYFDSPTPNYPLGLENSNTFFAKAPADKIIPQDYEYHAKLLAKSGKDSLAILDFKKALELQPDKIELNGDIANEYIKMKRYPEAIAAFKSKMNKSKPSVNDYFGLSRAYYYSKDFINADSSALHMINVDTNQVYGYLWRAKSNVQLDPKNEKWLAKPFYEKYISKVKPEEVERSKKDLIDAYTYLGVYYINHKDNCTAKIQFKKVMELDSANANAKKFLDSAEAKKCP
jgi:tetratricopeptide (TPR) repeat protein